MAGSAFDRGYFLSKILSEIRHHVFSIGAISKSRGLSVYRGMARLETLSSKAFQATASGEFFFLFFIARIPALC
jgi:hypothetical protein